MLPSLFSMAACFGRVAMYPKISGPHRYKAALYLRLSKEDDKKENGGGENGSESIINQRAMLEGYAARETLVDYRLYIDDGYSGGNFQRPAFERMIADIEAGIINMVVTKDMSRLGRDYIGVGHYMERYFPEKGVRYISLLDGIDTGSDSYNSDITPFKAIVNDMVAKETSKKVTRVKRDKQDKGLFIGGKAPYGYQKHPTEKNAIVTDGYAAEIVRGIFQLALEGKSCREIAKSLNAQKVQTPAAYARINLTRKGPYSGLWSAERISFMLQNEVYAGKMVQGRSKKVSYKSKKSIRVQPEDWIVRDGSHEPLIDREVFDRVGLLIKSRERTRQRTHDYLLKGLIHCYECGHPLGVIMRPLAGNRETLYFVCRTYQRFTDYAACTCHCEQVERVTDAVMARVGEVCRQYAGRLDLGYIAGEAQKRMAAERQRFRKNAVDSRAAAESIKDKIDRAYGDRLSGLISEDDFQRMYQRLKDEQAALQANARTMPDSDGGETLDRRKAQELADRFLNAGAYGKELLVSLIERIELTQDKEVFIHFRFRAPDGTA